MTRPGIGRARFLRVAAPGEGVKGTGCAPGILSTSDSSSVERPTSESVTRRFAFVSHFIIAFDRDSPLRPSDRHGADRFIMPAIGERGAGGDDVAVLEAASRATICTLIA